MATARHRPTTAMMNSSRLRVATRLLRILGMIQRAPTNKSSIMAPPLARKSQPPPSSLFPASRGVTSIMGTTMMSWNSSTARVVLPPGLSRMARSCISLRTMAVLERATRNPQNIEMFQENPSKRQAPAARAKVPKTCIEPPSRAALLRRLISLRLNSRPMVNNSSTTPISARISTSWALWMIPKPWGPSNAPLKRKPRMLGRRSQWQM